MARYILCTPCKERMEALATAHNEYFESVEGSALTQLYCDGGCFDVEPRRIEVGQNCHAAILLPTQEHVTYKFQKPELWAAELIQVVS